MRHMKSTSLAALVAALLATSGCGTMESGHAARPSVGQVTHAIQRETRQYREWDGTLDGYITAEIRPQVEGFLIAQHYRDGDFVEKGDLLFEIYPGPIEGTPGDAAPSLGGAGLSGTGLALGDARTKVVAPFDGIASGARTGIGRPVDGNTVLATVATVDWIRVYFHASRQEYSGWAKRRDPAERYSLDQATTRAQFDLVLDDGSLYGQRGHLLQAGRQPDLATGLVALTAVFPNPGHILRPGQRARLRGAVDVSERTLLVPQQAVFDVNGLPHVAVVGPDSTIAIRTVQAGERVGDLRLIEDGLRPEERIVVAGMR